MMLTQVGPVGGNGGTHIDSYIIPTGYRLKEIHLLTTTVIEGIQFSITDGNGGKSMPVLGGNSTHQKRHFVFTFGHGEYLIGLSGRYGWYIDCIRIHTNLRLSPSYGGHGGEKEFYFVAKEGEEVVGLVGRAGWFVDALGIVTQPLATSVNGTQNLEQTGFR